MPAETVCVPHPVAGVLVDLAGVLYDGDTPIPGAADAVNCLHQHHLPVRYVTNTTRSTRAELLARLHRMGLPIQENEIFTAPLAAKQLLQQRNLRPLLLIHPNLEPEFAGTPQHDPNAVVLADAGDAITYDKLNRAFRLLMHGAAFIAMANNRFFKEQAGLSLDAGPFVAALEFATGKPAEIVGKPAPAFFSLGLNDLHCTPDQAVMIGDDVRDDVLGAAKVGLHAILVRTGKYRRGDESQLTAANTSTAENFPAAVDAILANQSKEVKHEDHGVHGEKIWP